MGKGRGGGGHTPFEAKESGRSKQLVKIVEVISEGEVYGLADGMKSIYFDKTPVQNKDGSYNFKNVQVEGRVGGQVQDLMAGFNTSEKEVGVGTLVKKNLPLTRTVTDSKVSRLRLTIGVQSLFKQEDNGDTNGTSVNFVITIGSRTYPVSISGKYSSQYLQHHTFDNLPSVPFIVKVERTTDDSTTQRLQNNTIWSSYTEIIDTEFAYPNTALMGVKFDSEYFSNIPTRTYDLLGLKVKVPSNYDTRTRQYTGMWDGTFKIDWTDNPAWVLYDVVTNKRYGLGGRLGEFGADKWALYQVAQYCDQLVPDGFGGQEPRFTCNVWLTEQRSAYQVINDICSIFRAMPVWNGQQLTVVMDRPADPVWTYTNANVDESGFSYTFSARKSRHNAIQVEYADKENSYEKAIEYVSDDESIRKNGLNVKKITAFGCTSRGQAHRTALWLLQTEKLETKTVTFTVGAEGLMHIPGDIIKVADTHYAGTNIGGRVLAINGMTVTLDREITISGNSYLSYINANAKHQNIKIISVNGAEVTLDQPPLGLELYGVWSLTTQQVTSQLFKALSVKEEDKGKYTITALQHEPQKEAIVDSGAHFEPVSFSEVPDRYRIQNVDVAARDDGIRLSFEYFAKNESTVKYQIKLYRTFDGNRTLYKVYDDLTNTNISFTGLPDGDYTAEIRAKNGVGQLSEPVTKSFSVNFTIAELVTVSKLMGIDLNWRNPIFANTNAAVEIWVSQDDNFQHARKLVTLAYPTNSYSYTGLGTAETYYFWARMVSKDVAGKFTAAVVGVTERDATKIVDYIHGQISKSALTQELVGELTGTSQAANAAKSMAENAVAKVLAEAQTRSTQINELKQVDERQAQAIRTVTVKADNALSGIAAEQKARADGDRANADQINAVTARVGSVESSIVQMQHTATTNSQSVAHQLNEVNAKLTPIQQKLDEKLDALVKTTLDLTRLDQNKWYPVTFDRIPTVGRSNLIVRQDLWRGLHSPVWATHGSKSFSLLCDWIVNGSGWGAIEVDRQVNVFEYGFTQDNKSPILNLGQLTQSSIEYCCLRGGAKYDVFAPKGINVELRTSDYTKNTAGYTQTVNVVNNYDVALVPKSELKSLNANISVVSKAVADVSGKLSATHTIKTQVIGGGRTAIAGIALGASSDGNTAESSVIVMADKFSVVANANDGNVKPVFSVANGQVGIRGDLLADGSIIGRHIQANQEIRAPRISGGEIDISGNDGILRVGRTGNFLVRASSQNRGLVMNNDQIIVYDNNGKIRVKIGRL